MPTRQAQGTLSPCISASGGCYGNQLPKILMCNYPGVPLARVSPVRSLLSSMSPGGSWGHVTARVGNAIQRRGAERPETLPLTRRR